jgi:azurin
MNPATAIIPPVIFRLRLMSAPHLANQSCLSKVEAVDDQFQFDHLRLSGYCLPVNINLLLSKALLLSGAAVGF